jgi:tetratricopeptide (TPR) repeat protein
MDLESLRQSVATWLHEYRTLMFGVVGVALLIVVGLLYVGYLQRMALVDFRAGVAALQSGELEKAITSLEKLRQTSVGGVEVRTLGLFYLGEAFAKIERKDDARKAYEDALAVAKSGEGKTQYIRQLIAMKLGQNAEQREDYAQAQHWYDQAAAIEGGPLQTEALAQAARALEKANDHAAAIVYYQKLTEKADERYPLVEVFREKTEK